MIDVARIYVLYLSRITFPNTFDGKQSTAMLFRVFTGAPTSLHNLKKSKHAALRRFQFFHITWPLELAASKFCFTIRTLLFSWWLSSAALFLSKVSSWDNWAISSASNWKGWFRCAVGCSADSPSFLWSCWSVFRHVKQLQWLTEQPSPFVNLFFAIWEALVWFIAKEYPIKLPCLGKSLCLLHQDPPERGFPWDGLNNTRTRRQNERSAADRRCGPCRTLNDSGRRLHDSIKRHSWHESLERVVVQRYELTYYFRGIHEPMYTTMSQVDFQSTWSSV